jgi:uracil-DNA glycosylase
MPNKWDIKKILLGVDKTWKEMIRGPLRPALVKALEGTAPDLAITCPVPERVFASMRYSRYQDTKVVIIGQDPYYSTQLNKYDEEEPIADGLSFSCPSNLQPSVKNIYSALVQSGILQTIPKSGDLTMWASQGVLLLNRALTTLRGTPNAHMKYWKDFTNGLIQELSQRKEDDCQPLVFMLWGRKAQELAPFISDYHTVLTWCHPSSLSKATTPREEWFEHCDHFTQVPDIDWNPERKVYMYTDGASTTKQKPNFGGWAFYVDGGKSSGYVQYGKVEIGKDNGGEDIPCTNQRAEGTALIRVLEFIIAKKIRHPITIVSDSQFYINTLTDWIFKWHKAHPEFRRKNNGDPVKNRDIILRLYEVYTKACEQTNITLQHITSHRAQPPDIASLEYRLWYGNFIADEHAGMHHDLETYDKLEINIDEN